MYCAWYGGVVVWWRGGVPFWRISHNEQENRDKEVRYGRRNGKLAQTMKMPVKLLDQGIKGFLPTHSNT